MSIPFTQFLMPDGRARPVLFNGCTRETEAKAKFLIEHGYCFEIEMLSDFATVSAEVVHRFKHPDLADEDPEVIAGTITRNGPASTTGINEMVTQAYDLVKTKYPELFDKLKNV